MKEQSLAYSHSRRGRHGRPQAHRAAAARRPARRAAITRLTLQDVVAPAQPAARRCPVEPSRRDFAGPGAAAPLVADRPDVIFHLAAIVSGEAEADFDKGYRINLDGTRQLLEAIRPSRRRLQAAARLHLLDRGVRRAVPRQDRRRVLPHAADELRHPEGDRRTPDLRLFAPRLSRRHRHPPADGLRPSRPPEQGCLGLFLQHHSRAAGRRGGGAAGLRGRAALACHAALDRRLPAPCRHDGSRRGRLRAAN